MIIRLNDEYFIDHKNKSYSIKKRYIGIRNGEEVECEKFVSHHISLEEALNAFRDKYCDDKTNGDFESVNEYISVLRKANNEAVKFVQDSCMETFIFTQPVAKGNKPQVTIADFIPVGRENAIKREELLKICISNNICDSDRKMRQLIEKDRIDYVIINLSDGNGYYRPTHEDLLELRRYIRQEDKRAKAAFRNTSLAKKLLEDYTHGRL